MNPSQTAKIAKAVRHAHEAGGETCATFEVAGQPERWLQFIGQNANAAYPHSEEPARSAIVRPLLAPPAPTVIAWESGTYATFEFASFDAEAIARWIDRYFVLVLGCTADFYTLDISVGDLDGADLDGDSSWTR